ncbi:MAG: hypothetical protein ABI442_17720 [Gemmatimonadaceae bacterium]
MFRRFVIGAMVVTTAAFSVVAGAQAGRIPTRTVIGINPLGLPADIGTIEIESAVAQGITLGATGSYIDVSDTRFTTLEFKLRYYPGDVVLRGLSVGATAGSTRFSNIVNDNRETLVAPTLGLIVDYNWLLGRSEHFLIGTGVGTKRVLASDEARARANVDRAVFTARLIVGVAF